MNHPALAHAPTALTHVTGQDDDATSAPVEGAATLLGPEEDFPGVLAELSLTHLQVLHSRICLQLHHEYLNAPQGAHPATLDRHQELVAELATRRSCPPVPAHE